MLRLRPVRSAAGSWEAAPANPTGRAGGAALSRKDYAITDHRTGFPSPLTIPRLPNLPSAASTRHNSVAVTPGASVR